MEIVRWLKSKWKYYLDDAKQELNKIYEEHSHLQSEDIKVSQAKCGHDTMKRLPRRLKIKGGAEL